MNVYILFLSWILTVYVTAEPQLHPIHTEDLQSIVDSAQKDIDRHIKKSIEQDQVYIFFSNTLLQKSYRIAENIRKLLEMMIEEYIYRLLVKNLGTPSNAKSASTKSLKSTETPAVSPTYLPLEQPSSITENASESLLQTREIFAGTMKPLPGIHFPDYTDIPKTSFTCPDKTNISRFYADLDTGCQVFHVCSPERKESFLCPMGTIFNQALLVCDYWYNTNCSLAPSYYTMNLEVKSDSSKDAFEKVDLSSTPEPYSTDSYTTDSILSFTSQFMPVRAKVVVYPERANKRSKIVTSASIGQSHEPSLKSKSRLKHESRHSKVLQFTDNARNATYQTLVLKLKIILFRFHEALDDLLMDVKNSKSLSMYSGDVESVVKILREFALWFSKYERPQLPDFELGSDLYYYDIEQKSKYQKMRNSAKENLESLATKTAARKAVEDKLDASEIQENIFQPTQITDLDSKLSIKTETEQTSGSQEHDELSTLKVRKRSVKASGQISSLHEGPVNLKPETKKTLLKNYVKHFNSRRS